MIYSSSIADIVHKLVEGLSLPFVVPTGCRRFLLVLGVSPPFPPYVFPLPVLSPRRVLEPPATADLLASAFVSQITFSDFEHAAD